MKPILAIFATTIVVIGLAVAYVVDLAQIPTSTVHAASTGTHTASLNLDVVPNAGAGPHPDWVQYQTFDLNASKSATQFVIPVSTWVTVTIHQYDTPTTLRNEFFGLVQGTQGDIAYLNGKPFKALSPDIPSHTFSVPGLGVNVPLAGVPATAAPNAYQTIKFTFYSGNVKKIYHWQCFDPCGWGAYGNGGPMQTYGYMDGRIQVV